MRLEFSPHRAFQVKDYKKAVSFFQQVMGMDLVRAGQYEAELKDTALI